MKISDLLLEIVATNLKLKESIEKFKFDTSNEDHSLSELYNLFNKFGCHPQLVLKLAEVLQLLDDKTNFKQFEIFDINQLFLSVLDNSSEPELIEEYSHFLSAVLGEISIEKKKTLTIQIKHSIDLLNNSIQIINQIEPKI